VAARGLEGSRHNDLVAKTHVVKGKKVSLKDIDTHEDGGLDKAEGEDRVEKLLPELFDLQELMYAAGNHSLLIVLQGMDTSGKEGAIGCISKGVNAHGIQVSPFKVPTEIEISHDFLWRIHAQAPQKGMIGIFNRSHYEDVVVVRVHKVVNDEEWKSRYEHIRNFEKLLVDSNTIILKFFLHISKEEQEERLLAREKDPRKAWKLSAGDWKERQLWDDYMKAYEDALGETSMATAPWHIVPADRKWYRNLLVTQTVVETLRGYQEDWTTQLEAMGKKAKKEIDAFRKGNSKG
jgi:PPK2 family polyphosphate:nucleotide phosphotransferase